MPINKKLFASVALSLVLTAAFAVGSSLKAGVTKTDIWLGSIWVFVISMIVFISLSHVFSNNNDQDGAKHQHH